MASLFGRKHEVKISDNIRGFSDHLFNVGDWVGFNTLGISQVSSPSNPHDLFTSGFVTCVDLGG